MLRVINRVKNKNFHDILVYLKSLNRSKELARIEN